MKIIDDIKSKNKKIVMTNGCFDILHPGHIHLLKNAKKLGDILVVAINSDESVKILKGNSRPINDLKTRIKNLEILDVVDYVISFSAETPKKIIEDISPDTLVKGGDYNINDIVGAEFVRSYGGKVKTIKILEGFSTTNTINQNKKNR
jgi:rfaE bifunctional protein nucleotidyltransferase chain/domain|tara:strand:+ start:662 stop:1105 length:444 start_codon:yes stop_codon:yes gene_type:complete